MPTFNTGRSRTLTWNGDITDSFHGLVYPVTPPAIGTFVHNSDIDLRVIAYSKVTYLVRFTTYRDPNNLLGSGITQHVTATIDLGDGSPVSDDQYTSHAFTPLFSGKEVEWDMSGSWQVTCPAIERCEIYSLGDADPDRLDPNDFPTEPIWNTTTGEIESYGGAYADGLKGFGIRFFEVIEEGADLVATITCAGAGTATVTKTMPFDLEAGYGVWNKSLNAFRNEASYLEIEHFFNGQTMEPDLSETLTATGVWGTATISIEGDRDIQSGSGGGGYTIADSLVVPPISWKAKTEVRKWDTAYPAPLQLNLLKLASLVTPITFAGSSTIGVWRQRYVEIYNEIHEANTNLIASRTKEIFDQYPVRAWLDVDALTSAQEDSRDWRLCFLGKRWEAGTIAHATAYVVDNGASATGWAASGGSVASDGARVRLTPTGTASLTRSFATDLIAEGYRYLDIRWRSNGIAAQTVTVAMAGKEWTAETGADGSYVTVRLDLCCAGNETDDVEPIDTRFEIEDPGGYPTAKRPKKEYLMGWGVNYVEAITFSGIDGAWSSFDIDWMQLSRDDDKARLSFLAPFSKFGRGWTSESDTTTLQQYAFQYSDGRPTDWPAMAYVAVPSGTSYYRWFTITELLGMLEYSPGWSVEPATSFPADGYFNNGLEAYLLAGGGATFDFNPMAYSFSYWTDVEADDTPITLMAQALWDEAHAYPGAGRGVWDGTGYDSANPAVPLVMAKHLRGRAEGMIFNGDQTPRPAVHVEANEVTSGAPAGSGTSDTKGVYRTGSPWGRGNRDVGVEAWMGALPYLRAEERWQNRYRGRTSFRRLIEPALGRRVDYDVSRFQRHVVSWVDAGTVYLGLSGNRLPIAFATVATSITADIAKVAWDRAENVPAINLLTISGGVAELRRSLTEGATWTMPISVATATEGDLTATPAGERYVYYRDSGGTIQGKLYDLKDNLVRSWATNLTGVDDADISAVNSTSEEGSRFRIHLFYAVGGSMLVASSFDGETFS